MHDYGGNAALFGGIAGGTGEHKLTFKRPDLNLDRTENITIRPGEKFKQSFALESESD